MITAATAALLLAAQSGGLPYATAEEARARAVEVVEVAVDHVGVPRGVTGGPCHLAGDVVRSLRGEGRKAGDRISLSVLCVSQPRPGDPRRMISEDLLGEGRYAFYFDGRGALLDVEPLDRRTIPASARSDVYAIRILEPLPYATSAEARANAAGVIEILVEHTAVPRQTHGGYCPVQGEVVRVVRGAGLSPRGRVDLVAPCVGRPQPGDPRRISEGAFATGSRSLLYLSDRMELLDAERVDE